MTTPAQENPPPEQTQDYPGRTSEMDPQPRDEMRGYEGRGLLAGKRTLVTGGDSGIGRAVAVAFAKEGADVAIAYLSEQEDEDAQHTADLIKEAGRRCVTIRGDLAEEANCQRAVDQAVHDLGGLDILVNNVATQQPVAGLRRADHAAVGPHVQGQHLQLLLDHEGGLPAPARRGRRHQHRIHQRPARQQDPDRLLGHQGSDPGPHLLPGPGLRRARHPGQQRRAGPGVDTADPGHLRRGQGRQLRRPGADGPRRASRRDRPVVRVLRGRPDVELLLR